MSGYDDAKEILCRTDPHASLRPQESSEWQGGHPLPSAVVAYYAGLGPDDLNIPGYGNGYFLPSLANLWAHQTSYRTHGHTEAARQRLTPVTGSSERAVAVLAALDWEASE